MFPAAKVCHQFGEKKTERRASTTRQGRSWMGNTVSPLEAAMIREGSLQKEMTYLKRSQLPGLLQAVVKPRTWLGQRDCLEVKFWKVCWGCTNVQGSKWQAGKCVMKKVLGKNRNGDTNISKWGWSWQFLCSCSSAAVTNYARLSGLQTCYLIFL